MNPFSILYYSIRMISVHVAPANVVNWPKFTLFSKQFSRNVQMNNELTSSKFLETSNQLYHGKFVLRYLISATEIKINKSPLTALKPMTN